MGLGLSDIFSGVTKGISDLVGKFVTDPTKKMQAENEIKQLVISNAQKVLNDKRDIIVAEAQGKSWLQRNWRPLVMVFFCVMLGIYWFGLAPAYLVQNPKVVDEVFSIIKLGIGGYIAAEGVENVTPHIANAIQNKANK